jgi:hypothetical protein
VRVVSLALVVVHVAFQPLIPPMMVHMHCTSGIRAVPGTRSRNTGGVDHGIGVGVTTGHTVYSKACSRAMDPILKLDRNTVESAPLAPVPVLEYLMAAQVSAWFINKYINYTWCW